jgi:hypothetical protein
MPKPSKGGKPASKPQAASNGKPGTGTRAAKLKRDRSAKKPGK